MFSNCPINKHFGLARSVSMSNLSDFTYYRLLWYLYILEFCSNGDHPSFPIPHPFFPMNLAFFCSFGKYGAFTSLSKIIGNSLQSNFNGSTKFCANLGCTKKNVSGVCTLLKNQKSIPEFSRQNYTQVLKNVNICELIIQYNARQTASKVDTLGKREQKDLYVNQKCNPVRRPSRQELGPRPIM